MAIYRKIKTYKKSYKNYIKVIFQVIEQKNRIKVTLKDGRDGIWTSMNCSLYPLLTDMFPGEDNFNYFSNNSEYFSLRYKGKVIKFAGIREGNGDIISIYKNEDYNFLIQKEGIVIDVGANIGDSALYFAFNGIKKVIAIEPIPYSYNFAQKNINANHLANSVLIINAGYGQGEHIIINENDHSGPDSSIEISKSGKLVPLFSLKDLLNRYSLTGDLLLKMDCEGCEYNLLNEDNETLKRFSRAQIEYHYGYENLFKKFEDCGFKVSYTTPKDYYNKNAINKNMKIGYIYAKR